MVFKKEFQQEIIKGVQMGMGNIYGLGMKLGVYAFALDGVLIDTGAESLHNEFKAFFDRLDIDQVVLTHFHEDHSGGAAYLQQKRGLAIYMKETKIKECQKKADYPLYRKAFWGRRPPFEAKPIGQTFSSRRYHWEVVDTPGHAIDHISFLNRDTGQLFTGDLFCQVKTKVLLREESVPTIIRSLERVLSYDFDDVFCSHAGYLKKGRVALQAKLDYLQETEDRILKMYKEGIEVKDLTRKVFPQKYPITYFSFGEWSSKNFILSVIRERK